MPGVCVFIDGGIHAEPDVAGRDKRVRETLEDHGYRVVAIKGGNDLKVQVEAHMDVFR